MRTKAATLSLTLATALAAVGCSYAPAEESASIAQVVRLPDGGDALVTVQRVVARQPTGLSAFPDGGRALVLEREGKIYRVDGRAGTARQIVQHRPPDAQWESYALWVTGFAADGSVYVRSSGCPRDGECHPDLVNSTHYLLTSAGVLEPIDTVPTGVALPGEALAPGPGEVNYVRYSRDSRTILVRTDPDASFRPIFRLSSSGELEPPDG